MTFSVTTPKGHSLGVQSLGVSPPALRWPNATPPKPKHSRDRREPASSVHRPPPARRVCRRGWPHLVEARTQGWRRRADLPERPLGDGRCGRRRTRLSDRPARASARSMGGSASASRGRGAQGAQRIARQKIRRFRRPASSAPCEPPRILGRAWAPFFAVCTVNPNLIVFRAKGRNIGAGAWREDHGRRSRRGRLPKISP